MLISGYYFQTLASFLGIAIDPNCSAKFSGLLPVNAAVWAAVSKGGMVAQRYAQVGSASISSAHHLMAALVVAIEFWSGYETRGKTRENTREKAKDKAKDKTRGKTRDKGVLGEQIDESVAE